MKIKKKREFCAVCGEICEPDRDQNGKRIKIRFCSMFCALKYWSKLYRQWQNR